MKFSYEVVEVRYGNVEHLPPTSPSRKFTSLKRALDEMAKDGWSLESHVMQSNSVGAIHTLIFKMQVS